MSDCGKNLSPRRRRVAVLGGAVAAMSASLGVLAKRHPWVMGVWIVVLVVVVVYLFVELAAIRKEEER